MSEYRTALRKLEVAEQRARVARLRGSYPVAAVPEKVDVPTRAGLWIWIVLLGGPLVYELIAFGDGPGGEQTLSQVVKRLRRTAGVAGAVGLTFALFGSAVVLTFHWVFEAF